MRRGGAGGARPTESSLQFSLYLHSTGPCRRGSPRRLGKVFMGLTWKSAPSRNLPAFPRFVCSAYDDANPPAALRSVGVSKPHVPSGARVTLCIDGHVASLAPGAAQTARVVCVFCCPGERLLYWCDAVCFASAKRQCASVSFCPVCVPLTPSSSRDSFGSEVVTSALVQVAALVSIA